MALLPPRASMSAAHPAGNRLAKHQLEDTAEEELAEDDFLWDEWAGEQGVEGKLQEELHKRGQPRIV